VKKLLTATAFLLIPLANNSYGFCLWPFCTPYMQAGLICTNAARLAEFLAETPVRLRTAEYRRDVLAEYRRRQAIRIREDPPKAAWTRIYYREMTRYIKMVWRNPDLTPSLAEEMVSEHCGIYRQGLQRELERTEP
jgi:hypothetical protein